jgi:hypothetical protein
LISYKTFRSCKLLVKEWSFGKLFVRYVKQVIYFSILYIGFIIAETKITPYQYQSKLSSGFQSFAIIKTRAAELN